MTDSTPCPICVEIRKRQHYANARNLSQRKSPQYKLQDPKPASHGAGGPGWSWSACYRHYEVISAFEWLCLTGQISSGPPSREVDA